MMIFYSLIFLIGISIGIYLKRKEYSNSIDRMSDDNLEWLYVKIQAIKEKRKQK